MWGASWRGGKGATSSVSARCCCRNRAITTHKVDRRLRCYAVVPNQLILLVQRLEGAGKGVRERKEKGNAFFSLEGE
jgi:hypothetical protein